MSTWMIVGLGVVPVLLAIWRVIHVVRRVERERREAVLARYSPDDVVLMTTGNWFGQASRRRRQARGNGILVLTTTELRFERWVPHHALVIPLPRILSVETARRFLGKTVWRPLLKVSFVGRNGQTDATAWWIRDPEEWLAALRGRLSKGAD